MNVPVPQTVHIYVENNDFQYLEVLRRNRVKRQKARSFFVEGVMAVNRALAYGWQISAFAYSRERRLSDWAENILSQSQATTHFALPSHLMNKLSEKEDASELVAIVAMPEDDLDYINWHNQALVMVLDRPTNPGNLGTIIRSADAFGVDGIIITGHAVDLFDPKTIRASRGSLFTLPIVRVNTNEALYTWFEQKRQSDLGVQIIGTSAKAEISLAGQDFTTPTILMFGNETTGLRKAYQTYCDSLVKIPIAGSATSLNVASAASIMLYEVVRQRSS